MAIVTSRSGLSDYCLRSLGEPVIEVNLDDDQIDDRIDEAIQYYQEYHSDAVVRHFRKHLVTADDITNEYISLPEDMLFVKSVLPISGVGSSSDIFSLDYQLHLNDLYGLRNPGDLVSYELTKMYMSLIDLKINGMSQQVTFNRHLDRLDIEFKWGTDIVAGQYIVIEGYQTVDPETYTDVYNDMWLKRYCTALFKKQWGQNLIKFEGIQLPGGVALNGRQIYDDAMQDIEKLEEKIRLDHEEPVDFFTG
jgi:hypothetical protein